MKKVSFLAAIFYLLIVGLLPLEAMELDVSAKKISGRILESAQRRGISNLTVKITPPKDSGKPQKITVTDKDGKFLFEDIEEGTYLLEVSQGLTLLYRDVIDTKKGIHKVIPLKRK